MPDISSTIIPKSDQLNADSLLTGPITIRVTAVKVLEKGAEQPVVISYEGDDGKPYKPGKSMRRVLAHVWGKESSAYVGKSMTLYCDPKVRFGGVDVGGIRISHMSDIDGPKSLALTMSKGNKKPFTVQPLRNAPSGASTGAQGGSGRSDGPKDRQEGNGAPEAPTGPAGDWGKAWAAKVPAATDPAVLGADWNLAMKEPQWKDLREQSEEFAQWLKASVVARVGELKAAAS